MDDSNKYTHNLIGYLSPEGTFYQCSFYGHMEKAMYLCQTLYDKSFPNGIRAEEYLINKGFVIFYDEAIGFWDLGEDRENKRLTNQQKYFLMDEEEQCDCEDKVRSIKLTLTHNIKQNQNNYFRESKWW